MAENKKSFLLYCDYIDVFKQLPDDVAGRLIKHVFEYTNDLNPDTDDLLLKIAFEPIKKQLKRDLIKYEDVRKKNSENARKRWDAKKCDCMPKDAKNADTVNDTVTDTVIDNDIKEIYSLYPSKCPIKKTSTGKSAKPNKAKIKSVLKNISADELKLTIKRYIAECEKSKTYIKNFSTFLNNIPDYSEDEVKKEVLYTYHAEGYGMQYRRTALQLKKDKIACQGKITQLIEIKP